MTGQDDIQFEILDDGTIKVTTDKVSDANHVSADKLLRMVAELAGGEVKRTKRAHGHGHHHQGQSHSH